MIETNIWSPVQRLIDESGEIHFAELHIDEIAGGIEPSMSQDKDDIPMAAAQFIGSLSFTFDILTSDIFSNGTDNLSSEGLTSKTTLYGVMATDTCWRS